MRAFKKLFVKAGEICKADLTVKVDDLWFWNISESKKELDNGKYIIQAGGSSKDAALIDSEIEIYGNLSDDIKSLYVVPVKKIMKPGERVAIDSNLTLKNDKILRDNEYLIEFESSDLSVAQVKDGKIYALSSGMAVIKAKASHKNQTAEKAFPILVK